MDGVLIDSEPIYKALNEQLFAKLGVHITAEEYESFVGLASRKMWQYIKDKGQLNYEIEELITMEKQGIYEQMKTIHLKPIDGILDILQYLQSHNIPTAIASSNSTQAIKMITEKNGLHAYFHSIVGGEMIVNGKPSPDIFLRAAELINVPSHQCIVIEDSHNGLKGAKAAGMYAIGFQNPNSGNQDLSPANIVVDRLGLHCIENLIAT